MNDLIELVKKIENDGFEINAIVIIDKEKKKGFIELVQKIKNIKTFEEFKEMFNVDEKILNYIKVYCTTEERYKTFILFNPELYKDKKYEESVNKDKEKEIFFNVLNETDRTKSLIDYIKNEDTFISKFIEKQNSKSKVVLSVLRNNLLSKPETNLRKMEKVSEFETKRLIKNKNNYTIKKNVTLSFDVNGEVLKNNIRIVLPNKFILSLIDSSYISKTQIILSNVKKLGDYTFENYLQKIEKFNEIYESIFGEKMENVEYRINIKKKNESGLTLDSLFIKKQESLTVTKNNINMRCVTSLKDYETRVNNIKEAEKILIDKKKILSELSDEDSLLYTKDELKNIFNELFS